jgi:hypothetical protein
MRRSTAAVNAPIGSVGPTPQCFVPLIRSSASDPTTVGGTSHISVAAAPFNAMTKSPIGCVAYLQAKFDQQPKQYRIATEL